MTLLEQKSTQIPITFSWDTLLNGVTTTGAGTKGLEFAARTFLVQIVYATAAPTAATVKLQATTDGTNYIDLGETSDVSGTSVGFAVTDVIASDIRGNLTAYTAGSCSGVTMTVQAINV